MKSYLMSFILFISINFSAGPVEVYQGRMPDDFVITAFGDLVHASKSGFISEVRRNGSDFLLPLKPIFRDSDLVFANLETPLTSLPALNRAKSFRFSMDPDLIEPWIAAGFNMFSIANNHMDDAGWFGIDRTIYWLKAWGKQYGHPVYFSGAGRTEAEASRPTFIPFGKNKKIAFLAYSYNFFPLINHFESERVCATVAQIKREHIADFIIVSIHWGPEFLHIPPISVIKAYRSVRDAGADIILGHHPHVVQGVDYRSDGIIFFSLGNLSMTNRPDKKYTQNALFYSVAAKLYLNSETGKIRNVEVYPLYTDAADSIVVDNVKMPPANFYPIPATGLFARSIIADIVRWTSLISENKTELVKFGEHLQVKSYRKPVE